MESLDPVNEDRPHPGDRRHVQTILILLQKCMKVADAEFHQNDQMERFAIDKMIPDLDDAGLTRKQTHVLHLLDERVQLLLVVRDLKLHGEKDPTSLQKPVRIRGEMVVHIQPRSNVLVLLTVTREIQPPTTKTTSVTSLLPTDRREPHGLRSGHRHRQQWHLGLRHFRRRRSVRVGTCEGPRGLLRRKIIALPHSDAPVFVKRQIAFLVPVHLQPPWQQHLDLVHLPEPPLPEQPMDPIWPVVQPINTGVGQGVTVGRRNRGGRRDGDRVWTQTGPGRRRGRRRTTEGMNWYVLSTNRCQRWFVRQNRKSGGLRGCF